MSTQQGGSHAGRHYVVTAAAGGIGGELTGLLLAAGGRVFACDISGKRLAALQERFKTDSLSVLKVDVGDEAGAELACRTAVEQFGTSPAASRVSATTSSTGRSSASRSPSTSRRCA
jgi:NAD(P)-dependent dehydrogenase (short-subunit alcohol dehydrogenase family)